MIFKCGRFNHHPNVVIFVDGDAELDLPQDEWGVTVARTPAECWQRRNDLYETACFEVLTASSVLEIPAGKAAPSIAEIVDVFPVRQEHLLVQINKGAVVAKFDARYPPDVDEATRKLFVKEAMSSKKVALAGRPKARKSTGRRLSQQPPSGTRSSSRASVANTTMAHVGTWGINVSSMRPRATMPRVSNRHLNLGPATCRSAHPVCALRSVSEPYDHRLPKDRERCRPGDQVRQLHERRVHRSSEDIRLAVRLPTQGHGARWRTSVLWHLVRQRRAYPVHGLL